MIMVFMMSTMMVFADSTVEGNMTSAEFLANSNEQGIITLSQDTTIVDALKVDAQNYIIDLNGHTLKFTKDTNTFKNGTWVNVSGNIVKGYYHNQIPVIEITQIKEAQKPDDCFVYPPDSSYIPTSTIM